MITPKLFFGLRQLLSMSLTARVLMIELLLVAVAALAGYLAFGHVVNATVANLGAGLAEKQVLYDRSRAFGVLRREVALAQSAAVSQTLIAWLREEENPARKAAAIDELRRNRALFAGRVYFITSAASRNYYYEDATAPATDLRPRYRMTPGSPRDSWYFEALAQGGGCHLNVDSDTVAARTRVYINCVVVDAGRPLGVIGTAIDLSAFVHEVITDAPQGVSVLLVAGTGAVQAHRDPHLVNYHSVARRSGQSKTVFQLLERPRDRVLLRRMMNEVGSGQAAVRSEFLKIDGRRVLVGVGYLNGLGWYNVALMETGAMVDPRLFVPLGLAVMLLLALGGALLTLLFKRAVLDPLKQLEISVRAAERGDLRPGEQLDLRRRDEIGRLSRAFVGMSRTVHEHTRLLEARVRERTVELEQLAYLDTLTGLANRRGFIAFFDRLQQERRAEPVAMLLIDIDHFKQINDRHGHHAGDTVVAEIGRRIQRCLRACDLCGRWGGDEFIVLLRDFAETRLPFVIERVVSAVSREPVRLPDGQALDVRLSVGVHAVDPLDTIESATEMADAAMYRAKKEGRNRVVFAGQVD